MAHVVMNCQGWLSTTLSGGASASRHSLPIANEGTFAALGRALYACSEFCDGVAAPRFVVVGAQSSGKSSLLNALIGCGGGGMAIPVGTDMTTRVPLEIRTENASDASATLLDVGRHCEHTGDWLSSFETELPLMETDTARIAAALEDLTCRMAGDGANVCEADQSIHMRIRGPLCATLQLVDMPGLVTVAREDKGQPSDIKQRILRLCHRYLAEAEDTFLLLVLTAREDLETDIAWEIAKNYDPEGHRTCVVLTKPDFTEGGVLGRYLSGQGPSSLRAALGYHAVYLKHGCDLAEEAAYFSSQQRFSSFAARTGVASVARTIGERLKSRLLEQRASLSHRIAGHISALRRQHEDTKHLLRLESEGRDAEIEWEGIVNDLTFSLQRALFSRGSVVGRNLQQALTECAEDASAGNPFLLTSEDEAFVDELLEYSHGIHMPFGNAMGDTLLHYMESRKGAIEVACMQRAMSCAATVSDTLRATVAESWGAENAHRPGLLRVLKECCDRTLEVSLLAFRDRYQAAVRVELDFTWLGQELRHLFGFPGDEEHSCAGGEGTKQLVRRYLAGIACLLEHHLSKHAIAFLIKPFAPDLRSRLSEFKANESPETLRSLLATDESQQSRAIQIKKQLERVEEAATMLRHLR